MYQSEFNQFVAEQRRLDALGELEPQGPGEAGGVEAGGVEAGGVVEGGGGGGDPRIVNMYDMGNGGD
jgi:hypothetical protein